VNDQVLDIARAAQAQGSSVPTGMFDLIAAGSQVWSQARNVVSEETSRGSSLPSDHARRLSEVKLRAPIPRPPKNVFCLGLNYSEHLAESNRASNRDLAPTVPVYFTKAVTSIIGPEDGILFNESVSVKYDWEAELGLVIGEGGRGITRERAFDHVFGYTCFNDVSVRDIQNQHVQWFLGKSFDGTCPFGPWIVTADEVPEPHKLDIECRVNGVVKQHSNTSLFINDIPEMIFHLSKGITLEPGDLISTGTPSGIGNARTPPEYLKPGDVVEVEIEGVGLLRNPVVDINER